MSLVLQVPLRRVVHLPIARRAWESNALSACNAPVNALSGFRPNFLRVFPPTPFCSFPASSRLRGGRTDGCTGRTGGRTEPSAQITPLNRPNIVVPFFLPMTRARAGPCRPNTPKLLTLPLSGAHRLYGSTILRWNSPAISFWGLGICSAGAIYMQAHARAGKCTAEYRCLSEPAQPACPSL